VPQDFVFIPEGCVLRPLPSRDLQKLICAHSPIPQNLPLVTTWIDAMFCGLFMKEAIHPKYVDAEIRCACGNVIKTRSTKPVIIVGICNSCHPFYTGQQKFVDTAGRVDKFQQRMAKTQAAQAAAATKKKKK
jgi:large subunit ribosomal protein L31